MLFASFDGFEVGDAVPQEQLATLRFSRSEALALLQPLALLTQQGLFTYEHKDDGLLHVFEAQDKAFESSWFFKTIHVYDVLVMSDREAFQPCEAAQKELFEAVDPKRPCIVTGRKTLSSTLEFLKEAKDSVRLVWKLVPQAAGSKKRKRTASPTRLTLDAKAQIKMARALLPSSSSLSLSVGFLLPVSEAQTQDQRIFMEPDRLWRHCFKAEDDKRDNTTKLPLAKLRSILVASDYGFRDIHVNALLHLFKPGAQSVTYMQLRAALDCFGNALHMDRLREPYFSLVDWSTEKYFTFFYGYESIEEQDRLLKNQMAGAFILCMSEELFGTWHLTYVVEKQKKPQRSFIGWNSEHKCFYATETKQDKTVTCMGPYATLKSVINAYCHMGLIAKGRMTASPLSDIQLSARFVPTVPLFSSDSTKMPPSSIILNG
jgi:hypothetical protein